ncbi:MAG: T9SS type A sorting domain-containing protein [candidate division WOR-3 bacterium]
MILAALLEAVVGVKSVNGAWDSIFQLTFDPASQVLAYGFQRAITSDPLGNLHVAWLDQRTVPYQIWYRKFDRRAGMWLPETMLTSRPVNCFPPSVAGDGQGNVHLAWHMESRPCLGLWYKRYDAALGRWRPDTLLDTTGASRLLRLPAVAARSGAAEVHIVWFGYSDTGNVYQVFHKEFRPDSGWRPTEQVTSANCSHEQATVAVDSAGDLCVVWLGLDLGGSCAQVYCRRRVEGVWQDVELVSDFANPWTQSSPCVAAGPNGTWHVVWHGRQGIQTYQAVYHRLRTPEGWSGIWAVSGAVEHQQENPSVACRQGNECHVVWEGMTDLSPATRQVLYAYRSSAGYWSLPQQLTNRTQGDIRRPSIATDPDSGLHLVWHDASSGNLDVFYLHGWTSGTGINDGGSATKHRFGQTILFGPRSRLVFRLKDDGPMQLTVMTTTGRIVLRQKISGSGDRVVGLSQLPPGVYLARLASPNRSAIEKLVLLR